MQNAQAHSSRRQMTANVGFAALAVLIVALLVLPHYLDNYSLRLATTVFMYCVLAWSWNFIGGFVGYPSFGIAAFFGMGSYVGAIMLNQNIIPFWLSTVCAAFDCLVVAALRSGRSCQSPASRRLDQLLLLCGRAEGDRRSRHPQWLDQVR